MGYAALGLAIGGAAVASKTNPYSASTVKGAIGIRSPLTPGAPPVMPDQNSVLQAQQLTEAKSAAVQYGRAATVLTGTGAAGAGSTGDKLGP